MNNTIFFNRIEMFKLCIKHGLRPDCNTMYFILRYKNIEILKICLEYLGPIKLRAIDLFYYDLHIKHHKEVLDLLGYKDI